MGASQNYNVNLNIKANAESAKQSLNELNAQLTKLSQGANLNINAGKMSEEIQKASQAAMELQSHLQNATNVQTGKLDFSKLNSSLSASNQTLQQYSAQLLKLGPAGAKAFASLASQVSQAEIPLRRTNKLLDGFFDGLKRTAGWQIQSSLIHGVMGSVQKAFSYAKDLNKSLNDIRIVTNLSSDQMAHFAQQANKAARALNTTTTEYTKASLIYFQQGLNEKEVQDRTSITMKMANVTGQSAQTVSDQMTAVWNNYADGSKQLSHYADVMTALGAATASSTDEIAQGLQKFAAISDTVGLSYEYAASALATVTATTRESADVVGNAFKTLFSRIQGLQLGETLDDGTNLNKYSTALSKVGIQIKDSAGDMKSMDSILDEMGDKWSTLASDEKMALAQTVAGVRQYTQLMALMENWSYFKENLAISNSSTGTLERQQQIYEESWEAANNRLRTSFESLWDNLINSDSFITLIDGLSGIVDMITTITKSLGGGGGVLSMLSAGLMKVYSKDIARGIENISYSIKNMFGKNNKNSLPQQLNSYIGWTQEQMRVIQGDSENMNSPFQAMPHMSESLQQQMGHSAMMQAGLAHYAPKLSPEQQAYFQQQIGYLTSLDQKRTVIGEQYDANTLSLSGQGTLFRERINDYFARNANRNIKPSDFDTDLNNYIKGNTALGAANTLFGAIAEQDVNLELGGKQAINNIKDGIKTFSNSYENQLNQLFPDDDVIGKFFEDARQGTLYQDGSSLAQRIRQFTQHVSERTGALFDTSSVPADLRGDLDNLVGTARTHGQLGAQYSGFQGTSEKTIQELLKQMEDMSKQRNIATMLTSGAQAFMLATSAANAFSGVIDTLSSSQEMKQVDKVKSVFGGLVSTLVSGFMSFGALAAIPGVGTAAAAIGAIGMALVSYLVPAAAEWIDANKTTDLQKAYDNVENAKKIYQQTKTYNESIIETVESYEQAIKSLNKIKEGTEEWAESLYDANNKATQIIADNNLQAGDYYRDSRGVIQITETAQQEVLDNAQNNIHQAKMASDLAQIYYENAVEDDDLAQEKDKFLDNLSTNYQNSLSELVNKDSIDKYKEYEAAQAKYRELSANEQYQEAEEQRQLSEQYYNEYIALSETASDTLLKSQQWMDEDTLEKIINAVANTTSEEDAEKAIRETLNGIYGEDGYTDETVDALLQSADEMRNYVKNSEERTSAYEANQKLRFENIARESLNQKDFANKEEVLQSAGWMLDTLTEKAKEQARNDYNTKDFHDLGMSYAASLGYDQYTGFNIVGKDSKGIKYSYNSWNAEEKKNETITGWFTEEDIINFQAGKIALGQLGATAQNLDNDLTNLDNSTIKVVETFEGASTKDSAASIENNLNKGKDAVASYLSTGNFENATHGEILNLVNAGQKFVDAYGKNVDSKKVAEAILESYGFSDEDITRMAAERGMTVDQFLEDFRVKAKEALADFESQKAITKTKLKGKDNKSNWDNGILDLDDLSSADLNNLDLILTNLNKTGVGNENSIAYIEAVRDLLKNVKGVEDLQGLASEIFKIDPTSSDAIFAIMNAVSNAGGHFEGGAVAAQKFASSIANITAPNLDNLIGQLTNIKDLLGAIFSLNPSSNIDDATYEAIIAQFPMLAPYFSKNALGGWNFGGDSEKAKDIGRDQFLAKGEDLAEYANWGREYNKKLKQKGLTQAEIVSNYQEGNLYNMDNFGTGAFSATGFDIFAALALGDQDGGLGKGALSAVLKGMGLSSKEELDGIYAEYNNARAKVNGLQDDQKIIDSNNDGVIDENDEGYNNLDDDSKAAYAELNAASGKLGQIISILSGLSGAEGDYKDWNAERGSVAKDVDNLADMYGVTKDSTTGKYTAKGDGLVSSSENLQNYVNGLVELGEAYEYSTALAHQLKEAQAAGNEAQVQALIPQVEMATAIAAEAEKRGVSAEAVEYYTRDLMQLESLQGASATTIAKMAGELAVQAEGIEECAKNGKEWIKTFTTATKGSKAYVDALHNIEKSLAKVLKIEDAITKGTLKMGKAFEKWAKENPGKVAAAMAGNLEAGAEAMEKIIEDTYEGTAATEKGKKAWNDFSTTTLTGLSDVWKGLEETGLSEVGTDLTAVAQDASHAGNASALAATQFVQGWVDAGSAMNLTAAQIQAGIEDMGFHLEPVEAEAAYDGTALAKGVIAIPNEVGADVAPGNTQDYGSSGSTKVTYWRVVSNGGPGGGSAPPPGGSGGGGGGKEPKKVAQTRRSQVVKRYKNIDAKRDINKNRRDNMSKKTDKLYGEARITNLQKENKLLEEGLRLNEKKAEEALKNLKIDEESLRKMTKKYGYELELDSEGNIKNYEQILGDIYDQIHKLEADGELSEEEEKIKEKLEIKQKEIEGAMEDWEDTLKQLEELNNEYEELIDEMHSNELEQITYKLEFELELNELDTEWLNFLTERIGDDFTRASESMDLIIDKIKIVKNNIELYKKSIDDLMLNIQNDADRSLITGYLEDGVLTDEEAEILRDKGYDGLIEEFNKLAELKASAEELLVSVLDGYKNRIDLNVTSLEHYTSLMEHFGNVVDIVGQKQLGLSDKFIENMAKMRIQQSRDVMAVAQSELATYEQDRIIAETNLQKAREANDADSIAFWQEQLDTANTMIQEARDKLVTSFEDNLNAIADAFDKAVERIVQTFSEAVYAFGGLEGLSEDYSFIRENTELMAQDYEKIYELSKLNRNINKTLNDNNIIAGKQKMIELQKEINDLQASGAELSKYDLEYLQAKYELRLAEIELENAQNAKETVRLSKDSEGNWSYVYTASTEKIDEAQQKYEDALYKMQNLSYEYIDEMSEKIISASQAMMEEIQNLNKNNFENEQEYLEEINRIKAKYAESLGVTEEELNKALANNEELYDKDWQSYSNKTGYAISESQNWIDRYAESTLGTLMKSTSDVADYMNNFSIALDELTNSIYRVAGDYYNGIDEAFAAAGITKEDFASFVTTNTKAIMDASTKAREDAKTQAEILKKEYDFLAGQISNVQLDIKNTLGDYTPLLTEIRDILRESAALTKELQNKDATYTYKQAADLFNSKYGEDYKIEMDAEGRWNKTVEGVKNEILQKHAEAKTDEEKKHYADMYTWLTSYILPYVTSLDTGGYTGEWGTSGRLAMLHEKELILNANDTANFLDALNVSRELVNRVIEMNARASSFGIGGLSPSSIQDFAQNLEQQVTIAAEFPNAVDHNEIEEAFASLINTASQYANRK